MARGDEKELGKYFFWGVLLILIFLAYKIVSPYLILLISAFIFAYLTRPIYIRLVKKFPESVSAWLCILLILCIFILPLSLVLTQVGLQAYSLIQDKSLDGIIQQVSSDPVLQNLNLDFSNIKLKISSFFVTIASSFLGQLPSLFIAFIIFLFALFFMLKDWNSIAGWIEKLIPFKDKKKVSEDINNSTRGIVYGYLFVALIKFFVAGFGFYFSGVKLYILLAFIVALLSFIPGIGSPVVIIPMLIFYGFFGSWSSFIGILITGLILMIYLDVILTTKILGERSKIHPLIMILGVIGGTSLFGLFGFVIGPLILVYTIKVMELVSE